MGFKFYLYLLLIPILLVSNAVLIYAHEQAHKQIFAEFGVKSEIVFEFPSLKVIPDYNKFFSLTSCERNQIAALQSVDEVVGYQIVALFNVMMLSMIICFVAFDIHNLQSKARGD